MPFTDHLRVELTNSAVVPTVLYYQIDYTHEPPHGNDASYLHVAFRRENPTVQRRDFVIAEGLDGPGRFLGCNLGVRVVDPGWWYGEGEVKVYRDGDDDFPTICGTGLEDYVGTAWGMGPHAAPLAGAPMVIGPNDTTEPLAKCDFVGFYRWHLPDPIMFSSDLQVTIQQIGMAFFLAGQEDEMHAYQALLALASPSVWTTTVPPLMCTAASHRLYLAWMFQARSPTSAVAATNDPARRKR
jgi:hypothetical protein